MQLITNQQTLLSTFKQLMEDYKEYHWSVAWASSSHPYFSLLEQHTDKIKDLVVGLHFYQTHPDFIEAFYEHENVGFVEQTNGTFHPKSYLFYNSDKDWQLLVGSSNFTRAAFSDNMEMSVLLSNHAPNSDKILADFWKEKERHWNSSTDFDAEKLRNYRQIWKTKQRKINSLSNQYGNKQDSKKQPTISIKIEMMTMSWTTFIKAVKNELSHGLKDRLKVLDIAQNGFKAYNSLKDMPLDLRKFIAGIPNELKEGAGLWGYFGSMKGAGKFKNLIIEYPEGISDALDKIPLQGTITETHYQAYIEAFAEAVPFNTFLGTSTRLLAMKRPDVFVCVDSRNKRQLCAAFGITQSSLSHPTNYWTDVIERIQDANWYVYTQPKNKKERRVEAYRVAFLDALYYERN